jgi:predicted nuclease of predicted toxin-antitoxin system
MKLLIDMNLSPLWVKFFADCGIASVHWSILGNPSAPDSEILEYASANGFVIFTHDLDFGALLAKRQIRQPSVIQIRTQEVLPTEVGNLVLHVLDATRFHLESGALVTVEPKRGRIRLLPI